MTAVIEQLVMFWAKFLRLLTVCLLRPRSQIKRDCCFSSVILTLTRGCINSAVYINYCLILAILDVFVALAMRQQNHSGDVASLFERVQYLPIMPQGLPIQFFF